MKKHILILAAFLFISCSNNEDELTNNLDCNCDRVVEVYTFTVVGTPQNPALNYHTIYTTINDCTQVQKQKEYNTTNPVFTPRLNECR
jgi:hypothetical protein